MIGLPRLYRRWVRRPYKRHEYKSPRVELKYLDVETTKDKEMSELSILLKRSEGLVERKKIVYVSKS